MNPSSNPRGSSDGILDLGGPHYTKKDAVVVASWQALGRLQGRLLTTIEMVGLPAKVEAGYKRDIRRDLRLLPIARIQRDLFAEHFPDSWEHLKHYELVSENSEDDMGLGD